MSDLNHELANPRSNPPAAESVSVSRRFGAWLDRWGIWVWRGLLIVGGIVTPLVVFILTVDRRLVSVEQSVGTLDKRVTRIEEQVSEVDRRVTGIEHQMRNMNVSLERIERSVTTLGQDLNELAIAIAGRSANAGPNAPGEDGSEIAD